MLRKRILPIVAAFALVGASAFAMPFSIDMSSYLSLIDLGTYPDAGQQKVIDKAVTTLSGESTTLSKDLFNASKVDNWIEKAFDPADQEVTQLRSAIDDMTTQVLTNYLGASFVLADSELSVKAQAKKLLPIIKAIARHTKENLKTEPKYSKLAKFAGQAQKSVEKILAKYGSD